MGGGGRKRARGWGEGGSLGGGLGTGRRWRAGETSGQTPRQLGSQGVQVEPGPLQQVLVGIGSPISWTEPTCYLKFKLNLLSSPVYCLTSTTNIAASYSPGMLPVEARKSAVGDQISWELEYLPVVQVLTASPSGNRKTVNLPIQPNAISDWVGDQADLKVPSANRRIWLPGGSTGRTMSA